MHAQAELTTTNDEITGGLKIICAVGLMFLTVEIVSNVGSNM